MEDEKPNAGPSYEEDQLLMDSEVDPFDPKNYRKSVDPRLNGNAEVDSALPRTLLVGKPDKSWFIRLHRDPDFRVVLPLFTDNSAKRRQDSIHLFAPGLKIPEDMEGIISETLVAAAITTSGIPFLYILTVSDSSWYNSGLEVFRQAIEEWVRVIPSDGCYITKSPIAKLPDPVFPNAPFREWLERGFSKRLITSLDDPIVKKLRGAL